jgi:leucyl-tRNA synthetase
MHKKFDHLTLEKKWQENWKESGIYNFGDRQPEKEKEYVLVEWPYPSGNLHIGHWFAFAVVDIYVRARRMQGKQVLFPIGFDAFGLPAENAAIKRKLDPKAWTESNIEYMRGQFASMGNAFSWDKTTSSTDPEYYKWTQWMFTEFFKNDIAYKGKGKVNWCPGCNTVLANEQVLPDGTCERSGDVIEQREMAQWMLRITKYADRLIDDLDALDWPEHIKESQRNWIGRSEGARITFPLSTGHAVDVFTTRPDTLFGATYLVLAPELALLPELQPHIENWDEVSAYQAKTREKKDEERTALGKEKTGVRLAGITATNPATKEAIPVFISDYVISTYGTGALMAVPAHDERDFEFATKYELPIVTVISGAETLPYTAPGVLENSGRFNGMSSEEAKKEVTDFVGGKLENTYRLRDWSIGRQRYWGVPIPIVYDPVGQPHVIPNEHLPWHLPTDVDYTPTGEPPLSKSQELKERVRSIFGEGWTPDYETMDTFVDSSWYFLRYLDNKNDMEFSGKEIQESLMPIDIYFGGAEHTTMHVLYSRFWQKALFDLGLVTVEEPYKKRINRGLILGPDGNKMSKSKGNIVDPDEQVRNVGADTVKMYLAFMGPYGEMTNYPWDMGGIAGLRRFLERVNGLVDHLVESDSDETLRALNKTIKKVTDDVSLYKFNTAISSLMVFINHAEKAGITKSTYEVFLRLLAIFAPHLTEELWHEAGHTASIHSELWPVADLKYLVETSVVIGVQIDGKLRGTITIAPDASESDAVEAATSDPQISSKITSAIKKVVFVPGRILNLILEKG